MKPLSKSGIALNVLLIGVCIGFVIGTRLERHFSDRAILAEKEMERTDNANTILRALKFARAGSTNTIPFLEDNLDNSILSIAHLVPQTPASERELLELSMLRKIRDYRAQFPYKLGDPVLDEMVTNALALVTTNR